MKKRLIAGGVLVAVLGVMTAAPAGAQASDTQIILDNLFVFLAGVLVFFMQAGFAMLEAGLTRSKNVGNIMAKNLADASLGILAFFVVGYGIAFGGDGALIGTSQFFLSGADKFAGDLGAGTLTTPTFFFFQAVFAATAVTIASGAMAERTKFSTYLIFTVVMTAFIYPVVVHWTWGGGLIADIQIGDAVYSDFAGSTVVHSVGGWAALMGAWMLGPRIGKYGPDGRPRALPGHSMPLAVLGVFILWFGWFGFNPGSELAADTFVQFVAVNTVLAAAAGTVAAAATIWFLVGRPDVGMAANGALAGLVSITAPTGAVNTFGAVVIGAVGGVLVVFAVRFVEHRLKIDDPVGAFAVHGVCGVWGTLSIGLFATVDDAFLGREDAGLFYGGGIEQLIVQFLLVAIVAAWVLGTTFVLFSVLKNTLGLRVSEEEEVAGLDVSEHGSPGYGETSTLIGT